MGEGGNTCNPPPPLQTYRCTGSVSVTPVTWLPLGNEEFVVQHQGALKGLGGGGRGPCLSLAATSDVVSEASAALQSVPSRVFQRPCAAGSGQNEARVGVGGGGSRARGSDHVPRAEPGRRGGGRQAGPQAGGPLGPGCACKAIRLFPAATARPPASPPPPQGGVQRRAPGPCGQQAARRTGAGWGAAYYIHARTHELAFTRGLCAADAPLVLPAGVRAERSKAGGGKRAQESGGLFACWLTRAQL